MNPAVRVALLGFTQFECNHIEAGLQPGDESGRHYCVAKTLAASNLAVVNADDDIAVAQVLDQGRLASSVMLGTTQRAGAAAQLSRPISLVHLLRTLDQLVNSAPPMSAAVRRVQEEWSRMLAVRAAPAPSTATTSATAAMPLIQGRALGSETAPARPVTATKEKAQVLVVDSSDEVCRLLSNPSLQFGYQAHQLRDCAQALERLNRQPFDLIFLATGLDGMDCFHACKTIKRTLFPANRLPPKVIMLLTHESAVDAVRAEMAQADGCLSKPILDHQLLQLLTRLLPPANGLWQRTYAGGHQLLNPTA